VSGGVKARNREFEMAAEQLVIALDQSEQPEVVFL